MRNEAFNQIRENLNTCCNEVLRAKGADYARNDDRLDNFKVIADLLGCDPSEVCTVYFMKHVIAVLRYIREGTLESEPITERFVDLRNYVDLLWACVVEEAQRNITIEDARSSAARACERPSTLVEGEFNECAST